MVRTYKRKIGSRSYRNYSDEKLKEAIKLIANGELKFWDATTIYKISIGTLVKYVRQYKLVKSSIPEPTLNNEDQVISDQENSPNEQYPDLEPEIKRHKPGHPTILKEEDEVVIIDSLLLSISCEWG